MLNGCVLAVTIHTHTQAHTHDHLRELRMHCGESEQHAERSGHVNMDGGIGVESSWFWEIELAECKGTPVLGDSGRKTGIYNSDLKGDIWN